MGGAHFIANYFFLYKFVRVHLHADKRKAHYVEISRAPSKREILLSVYFIGSGIMTKSLIFVIFSYRHRKWEYLWTILHL
jgi:hypothetical protein